MLEMKKKIKLNNSGVFVKKHHKKFRYSGVFSENAAKRPIIFCYSLITPSSSHLCCAQNPQIKVPFSLLLRKFSPKFAPLLSLVSANHFFSSHLSSRPPPSPLIFFGSDLYSVSDRVDIGIAPQIAESSSRPPPLLVFAGSDPYTVSDCVVTSTASQIAPSPEMVQMAQMVCGSCRQLLSYPEGTRQDKCSCCETVNFVLEEWG
ncbi:hypothetical protein E1A91_A13G120500v1 [Gossypium mustelinum]|uniref:Zinc finger LSD1-type domain-containing protein n=1 Tax=Gossypium mustelinum TaxID=34275 RepID=A0A5D2WH39_GOSMU|nr:hypothetical protein E1A91_A13G120500v1 [Gossypium mustelinum]